MDKKNYTQKWYNSYKQMRKSDDLNAYAIWKKSVKRELKLLTEDELRGLQAYYSDNVILFERGKSYPISTVLVAMISAAASLITGMIIYISGVIDNAIAVMATQVKSTDDQKIIFDIVADEIGHAEEGGAFFAIFAIFILLVGGCWLIKELRENYSANRFYLFDLEMVKMIKKQIGKRKNQESDAKQEDTGEKGTEASLDCGNSFKEKKKKVYKSSVRRLAIWLGYYAIVLIVYSVLNLVIGIKYSSFKELIVAAILVLAIVVFFELVSNIPIAIATEKKILSKDDVDSCLKDVPMEQYRVVLEGKEKNEILEMYLALHENDRRRFEISMQSVYGALAIAFLPGIVTTLYGQYKEMGSSDAINIFVAFVFSLPLLLDIVLTAFIIIENDKVQRTPSAAKEIQDKIVAELAYEYLGIKKSG